MKPIEMIGVLMLAVVCWVLNFAAILILAFLFRWLWNLSLPTLGLPSLSYEAAFGLLGLIVLVVRMGKGIEVKFNQ